MAVEWYVVRTHYAQEGRAAKELNNQCFETFLPLAKFEKRRKDGLLTAVVRPLFTSYLFVAFDYRRDFWEPITSTTGVQGFIGYKAGMERPSPVSEEDMEELRQRLAEEGGIFSLVASRPKEIAPNDLVHVLFGPFRDRIVTVRTVSVSRVEVLLRFAGAESLWLPKDTVQIAC